MMQGKNYPRNYVVYLFILGVVTLGLTGITAQTAPTPAKQQETPQEAKQVASSAESTADKNTATLIMTGRTYEPVPAPDSKIDVENVNFIQRGAPDGSGEVLDVVFDIVNLDGEPLELYAFVMAYYERDTVDAKFRRLVPFPAWRKEDVDKEAHAILNMSISPENIDPAEVWDKRDPDYKNYQKILRRLRYSPAERRYVPEIYPPYWKYLNFAFLNPKRGNRFLLYGQKGPLEGGDSVITNYKAPKPDGSDRAELVKKHTYTIEPLRQRSVYRSHHYVKYTPNYKFFNMASIVLFDAERADKYVEKLQPLISQQQSHQKRRMEMDEKIRKAENDDNKSGLRELLRENAQIKQEESDLNKKLDAILQENYHLNYAKTFEVAISKH